MSATNLLKACYNVVFNENGIESIYRWCWILIIREQYIWPTIVVLEEELGIKKFDSKKWRISVHTFL